MNIFVYEIRSSDTFMRKYALNNDKSVRLVNDLEEWAKSMEPSQQIGRYESEHIIISTVFLGLDHNMHGAGDPILFETQVRLVESEEVIAQERYKTWDEANAGHDKFMQWFKNKEKFTGCSRCGEYCYCGLDGEDE